jgi:2-iminobutanoate/2-iminopropanoate deaminase
MTTNAIRVRTEPDFYAPFKIAQAYRVGDVIYVSGQAAVDDDGSIVGVGDFDRQAEKSLENLGRVLAAGGSGLSKLIKVTIFLRDMTNFPKIVSLRERYFTPPYPADTIVEVSSLALPELEFEIEAIALADGEVIDR